MNEQDRRVLNLAAEIADALDSEIPRILLRLNDILLSSKPGRELNQVKLDIWTYDLLNVLSLSIKQDVQRVRGGSLTTLKLANIICSSCIGLNPPEPEEFFDKFLPEVVENLFKFAKSIQNSCQKNSQKLQEKLENFQSLLDSVTQLLGSHIYLIKIALQSPSFLQLLLTDDSESAKVVLTSLQSWSRINRNIFEEVEEKDLNSLLDEIIYKVTVSPDVDLVRSATHTLVVFSEHSSKLVQILCTRYRSLNSLIKRWQGEGVGRDLHNLLLILESGSLQQAKSERLNLSAARIQATWRMHSTRKRLQKTGIAISKLQKSFRKRVEDKEKSIIEKNVEAELRRILRIRRCQKMRELRQKQLDALLILPASDVPKHMEKERHIAATRIQKRWKGHRERKSLQRRQHEHKLYRAAITIQRAVIKWLDRRRLHRGDLPSWQRPPGLTDERRVEIQAEITEWRETHLINAKTEQQRSDLHDKVQDQLQLFVLSSLNTRRKQQQREALMARIDMDSTLLLGAPSLKDVKPSDIDQFVSRSVPVAMKAQQCHAEEMKRLRQPWWKKLSEDYSREYSPTASEMDLF